MTKKVGADDRNAESQEHVKKMQPTSKVVVLWPHARVIETCTGDIAGGEKPNLV